MNRLPRLAAAVVVLFALGVGSWSTRELRAQGSSAQQPQLLMITEVQLKPEGATEWTQLQKDELIPAQKKGGVAWRDTWSNAASGDAYLRATVVPIANLAQFDGPAPIVKALGQEGAAAFGAKNRKLIAGSHAYIVRMRPELGFGSRPDVLKLGILTTVFVANGRTAEFEALLKTDVVPALKKAGVSYYVVTQVVYGGDTNVFRTLIPVNDFSELAKGHPLERALGADGAAKLLQKTAPYITRLDRTILRHVPDLSFRPGATTSP